MKHEVRAPFRYGSICSGIEAASVAWHVLGWEPSYFAEIDKFPRSVLAHHYPNVPLFSDFTNLIADPPDCDLLVGGTPCQAFSFAGRRQSLTDARGNLSLAFVELANATDKRRCDAGKSPVWIVWENVPGVLNTKDNAFGCFLAGLAGETEPLVPAGPRWTDAGYVLGPQRAVAWRVLDAQYFGLAQRRRRVFVVAGPRTGPDPRAILFEREGLRRDSPPRREAGPGYTYPVAPCLGASGRGVERPGETRGQDPVVAVAIRGRNGGGSAELGEEVAFALRTSQGGGDKPYVLVPTHDVAPCLQHRDAKGQDSDATKALVMAFMSNAGGASLSVGHDVSPTLRIGGDGGNAMAIAQAVCVTGDITHTLTANSGKGGGEDGTGRGVPTIAFTQNQHDEVRLLRVAGVVSDTAVRRLTPTECERLQGFPDGYTDIVFRNKPAADGPRYKALGNSMAVPVMRWIGRRIDLNARAT